MDSVLTGATPDRLAEAFGVPRHPRNGPQGKGPQGEALFQAELAVALLSRLTERGILTQGQARALTAGAGGQISPQVSS